MSHRELPGTNNKQQIKINPMKYSGNNNIEAKLAHIGGQLQLNELQELSNAGSLANLHGLHARTHTYTRCQYQ